MIHELFLADQVKVIRAKAAALVRADAVIVCSQSTRADLLKMFPHVADRTHLIPLCGPAEQPPYPVTFDDQTGQPRASRPYLLYVGLRGLYKNFLLFLQAFAQVHRQTQVQLLCYGGGEFKPDEIAEISRLGLTACVQQVSGRAELWPLYQHAQAFVYPSRYEGFGIPLLEAMANRCPVVCSNSSAFPEVAGLAAEYFEPDNVDTMADAILRVITSPQRQSELRALGIGQLALYTRQQMARATLGVYRQLMTL
jgi:glycosyltransferase involved in cell wall biosynthesis